MEPLDIAPLDMVPDAEPDIEPLEPDWASAGAAMLLANRAKTASFVIFFIAVSCLGRGSLPAAGRSIVWNRVGPDEPGIIRNRFQSRAAATMAPPGPDCTSTASRSPGWLAAGMA